VESATVNTPSEKIMSCFNVKHISEKFAEGGYYGSRDEPADKFITCPVRNHKNLEGSLDAFYR
jgi:hypothetical protein